MERLPSVEREVAPEEPVEVGRSLGVVLCIVSDVLEPVEDLLGAAFGRSGLVVLAGDGLHGWDLEERPGVNPMNNLHTCDYKPLEVTSVVKFKPQTLVFSLNTKYFNCFA